VLALRKDIKPHMWKGEYVSLDEPDS